MINNKKVKSCFVTGGAGFIGSHLVNKLVEKDCIVTVYDNLSSGKLEFINRHMSRNYFKLIQADLLDFKALKQALSGYDLVFHLAANPDVRAGIHNTNLDLKTGTIATYNVLEAMRLNGIGKLVFVSSSAVYGDAHLSLVSEHHGPLVPISLYGASKLASEGLISAFCNLFDMQGWVYRLANAVGPRLTHGVIFDFMNKLKRDPKRLEILGDGTQQKSYIHVDDCINGIFFGLENSKEMFNIFNLSSCSTTNVVDIADIVVKSLRLEEVEFTYTGGTSGWPGDVPQINLDTLKINQLGWKPKYTSYEAVYHTVQSLLDCNATYL